jgi:predicted PurR-regulated permease PerM
MSAQTNTLNFRNVTWWAVIVLSLVLVYQVFAPYLHPLGWGVFLAIFFYPVHARIRNWIGNRNWAAFCTLLLVLITLIGPTVWLSVTLIKEANSAVQKIPKGFVKSAAERIERISSDLGYPIVDVENQIQGQVRSAAAFVASKATNILSGVIYSFLNFLIFLLALFYLLRDGPRLLQVLKDVAPVGEETRDRMMGQAADMIQATIMSSVVVSLAQGVMGGILFWALGLPSPLVWGLVIGVLAFLPVIGPSLVWAPLGTYLIVNGQLLQGILLIFFGFVLVSSSDKVLRPLLIAGRARLNELLVLVSLLGGLEAFGLIGIILGPVIVATCVGMLKGYREALVDEQDTVAALPLNTIGETARTRVAR